MLKWRAHPSPREDKSKVIKILWKLLKVPLCLYSIKFGPKNFKIKNIQFCTNEGPHPFPIAMWKYIDDLFKKILRTIIDTGMSISTKLATKLPWIKGIFFFFQIKCYIFSKKKYFWNKKNSFTFLKIKFSNFTQCKVLKEVFNFV